MNTNVIIVNPEKTVFQAAELMDTNKVGCLIVIENQAPVGIVVASDFVRYARRKTATEEILYAMGRYPRRRKMT